MEFCVKLRSLPLWERGLKSGHSWGCRSHGWSLPLWERGLKSETPQPAREHRWVAPLVGAWIEIHTL